ncbi:hypothetical protein K2P47_05220 [Patescibacteria group bacterium]|nr:hypothetical protein [Patescibacteria group bacterium]
MQNNYNVLIIGKSDRIEILSINIEHNITFAANFEEAAEHLKRSAFGHVITDAVLPGKKTGLDILRLMRESVTKQSGICATVCHTETACVADSQRWNIKPSLSASFTFAKFYHGTIDDYWANRRNETRRCA